jgi:hypothetical protein
LRDLSGSYNDLANHGLRRREVARRSAEDLIRAWRERNMEVAARVLVRASNDPRGSRQLDVDSTQHRRSRLGRWRSAIRIHPTPDITERRHLRAAGLGSGVRTLLGAAARGENHDDHNRLQPASHEHMMPDLAPGAASTRSAVRGGHFSKRTTPATI